MGLKNEHGISPGETGELGKPGSTTPENGRKRTGGEGAGAGAGGIPGGSIGDTPPGASWDKLPDGKPSRKQKDVDVLELAFLKPEEAKEDKSKKKRKKETPAISDNFKALLTGVFAIAGSRNPIWIVQESELDMVVEPAGRIFERYISEKSDEISDIFLLVTALSIMLIPRVVLTITTSKKGGIAPEPERKVSPGNPSTFPSFAGAISGLDSVAGQAVS